MENVFLAVINMSLTASYIIPFVVLARLLLKKAPKIYSYSLWSVVLFRLLCPFSLESALSLLPEEAEPITRSTLIAQNPEISSGIPNIDQSINPILPPAPPPETGNSVNPLQIWTFVAEILWVSGIILMLLVASVSLFLLQKKLRVSKEVDKGVFLADDITSPFVFGVISPKIYLPSSINEEEIPLILAHERFHLKRFDHVTRLLSFVALTLHWFNPLVWISYYLSEKDMETSCDEGVLREKSLGERGDYATALLKFTGRRSSLTPLAFSENDTKGRVKNIMKMKKTKLWVSGLACILVLGLIVGLATSQKAISNDTHLYTQVENLKPLEISTKVAQKVGVTPDELKVSPDGDIVHLTNNFESYIALPFTFFFQENHQLKSGCYIHYYDNRDEEISDQSMMESKPKESYSLNLYLEAIKYLPQEEILSLCKNNVSSFNVYVATFFDLSGSDRHIYYSESGVQDSDNWSIPLMIQAYYPDGKNSQHGTGADIIWVYYTPSSDFTEEESSNDSADGYVPTEQESTITGATLESVETLSTSVQDSLAYLFTETQDFPLPTVEQENIMEALWTYCDYSSSTLNTHGEQLSEDDFYVLTTSQFNDTYYSLVMMLSEGASLSLVQHSDPTQKLVEIQALVTGAFAMSSGVWANVTQQGDDTFVWLSKRDIRHCTETDTLISNDIQGVKFNFLDGTSALESVSQSGAYIFKYQKEISSCEFMNDENILVLEQHSRDN